MGFMLVLLFVFLQFGLMNYGDFSCRFIMISNMIGFDQIYLLAIFLIFEIEIVIVLTFQSLIIILVVCIVTIYELMNVVM